MCLGKKSSSSSSSSKDKSSKSSSGGYNVTDKTTGKVTNYKSYDDAIAAANKIASDKGGSVEDRTTSSSSKDKSSSSSKDKSSSETKTDYSGTNFNTAFKEARADLGPGQEFTYNGKKYSTATAEERPDLSGTTKTETETDYRETTSSGRGDPRDFGFVAEDAAASRPRRP
jgi:hypothetical protein